MGGRSISGNARNRRPLVPVPGSPSDRLPQDAARPVHSGVIDPAADRHWPPPSWVASPTGQALLRDQARRRMGGRSPLLRRGVLHGYRAGVLPALPETLVGGSWHRATPGGQCAATSARPSRPRPAALHGGGPADRAVGSPPGHPGGGIIRVSPALLRRAATAGGRHRAQHPAGGPSCATRPAGQWQVLQRERGSGRQRAATALAQFIVVAEEFRDLYRSAQRQRRDRPDPAPDDGLLLGVSARNWAREVATRSTTRRPSRWSAPTAS